MKWNVKYSETAKHDINRLPIFIQKRIIEKIGWFLNSGNPLHFAKPLTGELKGMYRFRIGDYRVIISAEDGMMSILLVHRIGHRREIYE